MKSINRIWCAVLLAAVTPNAGLAQLVITGELRPRTEIRRGYSKLVSPGQKASVFISQRSRLNLAFTDDRIKMYLSLQDVRVWGDEVQLADVSSLALHEGWGEISFCDHFSLRVGRQELVYDDHRLLGNVGWVQQARSHDAALLKMGRNGWNVHLAAAYNNNKEYLVQSAYPLSNYRALGLLWINRTFKEKLTVSLITLADGNEGPASSALYFRTTAGPHLVYKNKGLSASTTFYYQAGRTPGDIENAAFMTSASVFYKIKNTQFGGGADMVSGNDGLNPGSKNEAFHTLFATNHKFYGHMDYFLDLPVHTGGGGLIDAYAQVSHGFSEKTNAGITVHQFLLANKVADPSAPGKELDKGLGLEIDLQAGRKILPNVSFNAGYSILLGTESMEVLKGGDKDELQQWGWLMLTFNPVFHDASKPKAEK